MSKLILITAILFGSFAVYATEEIDCEKLISSDNKKICSDIRSLKNVVSNLESSLKANMASKWDCQLIVDGLMGPDIEFNSSGDNFSTARDNLYSQCRGSNDSTVRDACPRLNAVPVTSVIEKPKGSGLYFNNAEFWFPGRTKAACFKKID